MIPVAGLLAPVAVGGTSTNELAAAVVTLILAIGGGVRWWVLRRDSKSPISTASAEATLMTQIMGVSGETLDQLREDIRDLRRRADVAQEKADEQGRQMDQIRRLFTAATTYIETLLRWVRAGADPPPPALPFILHEVIDPELHSRHPVPGQTGADPSPFKE